MSAREPHDFEHGDERGDERADEHTRLMERISRDYGDILTSLARLSIHRGLDRGTAGDIALADLPSPLHAIGASFVTLEKRGRLRGCIGSPVAIRPLARDVCENAFAAAFRDPRFPPLSRGEAEEVTLSLSLLSPPREITFHNEDDLLHRLHAHIDGLIIDDGLHRAVFLPQVWAQLPEPRDFLSHLKAKAGMSGESPLTSKVRAWRFHAHHVPETALGGAQIASNGRKTPSSASSSAPQGG